jgi:hypothetical protein
MRRSLIDGFTTLCIYSYAYYKVVLDSYSNYYLVELYIFSEDEVVHAHQYMFSEQHGRF